MRKIAQKANISATAIYRHFSNKEELFHHVVKKGFSTYTDYLIPAENEATPELRLRQTMGNALEFVLDHPRYFELIFIKSETKDELAQFDDLRADSKISFNLYSTRIKECMESGYLKEDNPGELSALLLSAYIGFFSLYTSGLLPRSPKEIKKMYWRSIDRLLNGLVK